jgi:murein DD-endopeptidase MepM/ murein hydrolase activator NlpD
MKKIIFNLLLLSALCFLISNFSFGAAPQEIKDAIEQKSQELQEISNEIKENQKVLEDVQGQGQTLKKEIKQTDYSINQLNLGIRSNEITIDKLSLEINSLQYEISDAEKEIDLKKEAIAKILQEFQRTDDETPLIIFLRSKSLADSVFEVQNLADLNAGLALEINDLKNIKELMADKLGQSAEKKLTTEIEKSNLKNRKIILDDVKEEKQSLLNQTKNQEKIYQSIISDLQKKQMALAEEINILEENLRLSFDPSVLPGKRPGVLAYPLTNIYVTQEYGNTAFAKWAYKTGFHNGVDFRASIGTPVYAAEDGEVFAVGNNGRVQYGKFVVIKHNNNLATIYAHLSRQIVQKGNTVKRGQVIGYSGNTGYSTGPHLHFGVYWSLSLEMKSFSGAGLVPVGVTVNPNDYL